jgi:hypothetical protein
MTIFYCIYSFSQETGGIKGIIQDSATGETIPYANIRISGTKLGTNSNINGSFLLQNIPVGSQNIQITAVGYKKIKKTIQIRSDEILLFNFLLSPEPIELPTITKTAERIKEVYETNISVQAITQEELNLIPMTVEKDIFRALKTVPGISSTGDVTSLFYVRGGGGDQNLILYDNMMIYNPYHAFGLFSIFNGNAIKVSEILTGGFRPEFGGRLSSVINIISREGNKNNFGGKLSMGILSGQGYFEGPLPNGSFSISYRKSFFDQVLKKFLNKDVPLSFSDFSGKITYDLSDEGKLSISGLLSKDEVINTKLTEPDYSWNNSAFGLNLQTFLANALANVSLSYSSFNAGMDPKSQNKNDKSESKVTNFFFNAKIDYFLGNNDLFSLGAALFFPEMSCSFTNNAKYYVQKTDDITETSLWVNYKWVQIEDLTAEFGLRSDFSFYSGEADIVLEPRLNFKYQLIPDLALKGSYSIMHQSMVTTYNEDEVIPLFEMWIPVKKPYTVEKAEQFVLGIDGVLINNLNVSLLGYYKSIDNFMGYNLDKQSRDDPDFSVGTGESYGIETSVKFNFENFFGWLAYTLNWSQKENNNFLFPPRYDKRHILNIILGAKLFQDMNISFNFEFSSGMPFTPISSYYDRIGVIDVPYQYQNDPGSRKAIFGRKNSKRLPDYHKLDMNISKSFSLFGTAKMNLSFDIINLYDQKNIFYFDRNSGDRVNMLPFLPSITVGVEI